MTTTENKTNIPQVNFGTPMINWTAPEFIEQQRGSTWFMVMGVIALALIVYGIYAESIIFSIVIILLAGVFFLTHKHKPRRMNIVITDAGIRYGDDFYPYEDIHAFWILFDPPHVQTLNLRVARGLDRSVNIQLAGQNPAEIRSFLGTEIPEWKNRTETLSEILIRMLRL